MVWKGIPSDKSICCSHTWKSFFCICFLHGIFHSRWNPFNPDKQTQGNRTNQMSHARWVLVRHTSLSIVLGGSEWSHEEKWCATSLLCDWQLKHTILQKFWQSLKLAVMLSVCQQFAKLKQSNLLRPNVNQNGDNVSTCSNVSLKIISWLQPFKASHSSLKASEGECECKQAERVKLLYAAAIKARKEIKRWIKNERKKISFFQFEEM